MSYVFYYRGKIIDLIEANKVVVLSGETGCGKTTQVITMQLDTSTVFTWDSYFKISSHTIGMKHAPKIIRIFNTRVHNSSFFSLGIPFIQ